MAVRWVIHRAQVRRLDRPIEDHLSDITDDVAETAQGIGPVDEGDMVATIRASRFGRLRFRVTVGGMRGPVTGKPVGYSHFVERGTSKMSAQPFMRPALFRAR